jgi:glycosyltransferase involved in cell wall biosynthesis
MRICHVTPHLPPDQAANALLPAHLGRWFADQGHEITFVTPGKSEADAHRASHSSLAGIVRRTRPRSSSRWQRATRVDTLLRTKSIKAALDDVAAGADLVHLHSNGLIVEVAAAWARSRGIPTVLTLYGTEIWHYRRRLIDPFTRAYQTAGAVTFYSQRLLDRARELGLDRPDLHVVYPAVSPAFQPADDATRERWRAELGIGEPHLVLNVKRLHPLAGQKHLVAAFARIAANRPDVRLVFCGTGPLRAELEAQAQQSGIGDRVTFAGLVPNDVVARFAAVADLFVLPSELEALPTVAVEALAAGTPVVSADHPGGVELAEVFGDDVRVVPREDVDGLERLIREAIDAPRRAHPGTLARVHQLFGPDSVRDAYGCIYESQVRHVRQARGT